MSDPVEPDNAEDTQDESFFNWSIMLRWFLIPSIVVAVGISVVGLIAVITTQEKGTSELLFEMGPQNAPARRWQAAYGLSALVLAKPDDLPVGFASQIIEYFDHSIDRDDEDPRFRQFLALILLNLRDRQALPVLKKAITSPIDIETRICAVMALSEVGVVGDGLSPLVLELIRDDDPAIRKVGIYAAGRIGGPETLEPLRERLEDNVLDVRWNAALSLARRGDASGSTLLGSMMDRDYVRDNGNLDWDGESRVVRNALIALAQLQVTPNTELLSQLAANDKDPEVRRLANHALQTAQSN